MPCENGACEYQPTQTHRLLKKEAVPSIDEILAGMLYWNCHATREQAEHVRNELLGKPEESDPEEELYEEWKQHEAEVQEELEELDI